METIVERRSVTSGEIISPFTLPRSFLHRRWWHRSVQQETLAEIVLLLMTFAMVGGMLWGFFQALSQWQSDL